MEKENTIKVGRSIGKSTLTAIKPSIPTDKEKISKEVKLMETSLVDTKEVRELDNLKQRERELGSNWGQAEINSIFTHIDDGRTDKDLDKIKVLEIGCGCGAAIDELHAKGIKNITGIDISEIAVDYCKKKGLKVKEADATKLPYNNNEFDFVYGIHLIDGMKIEAAAKIVEEAVRVSKKALFVISVNTMTDEGIEKLNRAASGEYHKRIKGIVRYTRDATPYQNDLLIYYKKGG